MFAKWFAFRECCRVSINFRRLVRLPLHHFYSTDAHRIHNAIYFQTAHLLKISQPADLVEIHLNGEFRRKLLSAYESYYARHIPEFGAMKTLPVLREILS